MPSPDEQVLGWAARSAAPSARVVSAAGMRAGGNPWLLRLAGAGSTCEVVLKTGDAAAGLDRQQFLTTVAALELAAGHGLPAPRLIAADLDGSAAGSLAVLMTVLAGSSKVPRVASAVRLRALGLQPARCRASRWHRGRDWSCEPAPCMTWTSLPGARQSAPRSCWPGRKTRSTACQCQTASGRSCTATCGRAIPSGTAIPAVASSTGMGRPGNFRGNFLPT